MGDRGSGEPTYHDTDTDTYVPLRQTIWSGCRAKNMLGLSIHLICMRGWGEPCVRLTSKARRRQYCSGGRVEAVTLNSTTSRKIDFRVERPRHSTKFIVAYEKRIPPELSIFIFLPFSKTPISDHVYRRTTCCIRIHNNNNIHSNSTSRECKCRMCRTDE